VNSSRRLERFSDEFTPFAPKPISPEIWVRGNGIKSLKRFQRIIEASTAGMAQNCFDLVKIKKNYKQ
jgi:hypothetical protein